MSSSPREYTTYLLECINDGMISSQEVVEMCLSYMSERDVADMMEINDIPIFDEEDIDC